MEKHWRRIQGIKKEELLKLIGDKLTANEFENIMEAFGNIDIEIEFSNDLRIRLQEMSKKVGNEISGNQFGEWLNENVSNSLIISRK